MRVLRVEVRVSTVGGYVRLPINSKWSIDLIGLIVSLSVYFTFDFIIICVDMLAIWVRCVFSAQSNQMRLLKFKVAATAHFTTHHFIGILWLRSSNNGKMLPNRTTNHWSEPEGTNNWASNERNNRQLSYNQVLIRTAIVYHRHKVIKIANHGDRTTRKLNLKWSSQFFVHRKTWSGEKFSGKVVSTTKTCLALK